MNNPLIAIRPKYAVMETAWFFTFDGAFDGIEYEISIFRMDKRQGVTGDLNVSWLDTENAIELVGPGYGASAYVIVPTADLGQALSFGQLAFALLEPLFCPLPILNVGRHSVPLNK